MSDAQTTDLDVRGVGDADAVAAASAAWIADRLAQALRDQDQAVLALSGGSTPLPMYATLAEADLDWPRVVVVQVDERVADADSEDRNWNAIERLLVTPTGAQGRPMPTTGEERDPVAAYGATLQELGGIDVAHLGLGSDGHTASLVPGDRVLGDRGLVAMTSVYQGRRRLTMTATTIATATAIVWEVVGASKRTALSQLLAGDPTVPASLIRRAPDVTVIADAAALGRAPASADLSPAPADAPPARSVVIKITAGPDDVERANMACNVAVVAATSGCDLTVFLAGDGVELARTGAPLDDLDLSHAPPLSELVESIYALGRVTVCWPCAARRGLDEDAFRPGTTMGGSAQFVEAATAPGATALVY